MRSGCVLRGRRSETGDERSRWVERDGYGVKTRPGEMVAVSATVAGKGRRIIDRRQHPLSSHFGSGCGTAAFNTTHPLVPFGATCASRRRHWHWKAPRRTPPRPAVVSLLEKMLLGQVKALMYDRL